MKLNEFDFKFDFNSTRYDQQLEYDRKNYFVLSTITLENEETKRKEKKEKVGKKKINFARE